MLAVPGIGSGCSNGRDRGVGARCSVMPVVLQTLALRAVPHAHEAASLLYLMVFNISIGSHIG